MTFFLTFNEMHWNLPTCRIPLDLTGDFVIIYQGAERPSAPLRLNFTLGSVILIPTRKGFYL